MGRLRLAVEGPRGISIALRRVSLEYFHRLRLPLLHGGKPSTLEDYGMVGKLYD